VWGVQGTQGNWLGEMGRECHLERACLGVVRARVRRGTGWGVTPGYAESPAGEVQGTQRGEVQGTQREEVQGTQGREVQGTQGREVQGTQGREVQGTQRARTLWRIEVRP